MPKVCLYCARYDSEPMAQEPLGISYLGAYLLQQGLVSSDELRIVDTLAEARAWRPDIVAVSAVSQVLADAVRFAEGCKREFKCLTVLGGYHVTAVPEALPAAFDVGVLGEGERPFAELVKRCSEGVCAPGELATLDSICFRRGSAVVVNPRGPLVADLDELPRPLRRGPIDGELSIVTSRGCPYSCIFCASPTFWERSFRRRSAGSVVAEIADLVERFAPRRIAIMDDLWLAHKPRFRAIVAGLEAHGIPGRVEFTGFCRSNIVHAEDIELFARMNFATVRFGAETGSEPLLQRLKGKSISLADHQRVIDLCRERGLPCSGSFMFGIPGETLEDLEATRRFLRRNRGAFRIGGFYLFNPIPGTPLWAELAQAGKLPDHYAPEALQIDFLKASFSWERALYCNEDEIPRAQLRDFIQALRAEFIDLPLWRRALRRVVATVSG